MATFGYTTAGGTAAGDGGSFITVCKFTLSDNNAVVSKLTAYRDNPTTTVSIKGVIYDDNAGTPNNLLGVTNATTMVAPASAQWIDLTFASPVTISAAGAYWLGFVPSASTGSDHYLDAGATNQTAFKSSSYTSPANPYGTPGGFQNNVISIYATYTATGGSSGTSTLALSYSGAAFLHMKGIR